MSNQKHTPGQWICVPPSTPSERHCWQVVSEKAGEIRVCSCTNSQHDEANARLIVRSVNSHHELVNIMRDGERMLSRLTGENLVAYARTWAALAGVALRKVDEV